MLDIESNLDYLTSNISLLDDSTLQNVFDRITPNYLDLYISRHHDNDNDNNHRGPTSCKKPPGAAFCSDLQHALFKFH